jgi:tetratricopeptide (TPR) repeat protein
MRVRSLLFLAILFGNAALGCAAGKPEAAAATSLAASPAPSTQASLTLAEITPAVTLADAPATQPAGRPPAEALTLYAQATDALQTGRRFTAINLLQKAIELDPQSFELNYALGRSQVIGRPHDDASIAAMEKAAAIRPDHLDLQTDLGRQYLAKGDLANALRHLRLAVQTSDYRAEEPAAPLADLFLARALQQSGYDRAALEQYAKLLRRVQGRPMSARNDPHLAFLITDRLYIDIGDLYARNGQLEDALAAFEPAARRDPSDFDIEARVVRALVSLRRWDEASRRAAEAVVRFRASPVSLELLREVHRAKGGETAGSAKALAAMYKERPNDTTVLFALVELLREDGRWTQADDLLAKHAERSPGEFGVMRQRVQLRLHQDDVEGAAALLVQTLTNRPQNAAEIEAMWPELVTPARANHLKLAPIQALDVPPAQAAAKELAVAAVAGELRRSTIAEQAIVRAVAARPPFPPAFRKRLADIWQRRGTPDDRRVALTDKLIAAAADGGSTDGPLPQELRGLSLLYRKQYKPAADVLAKLIEAGDKSPSLSQSYAIALRGGGEKAKFEQLMWKLLSDHPSFEEGYSTLYAHYTETNTEAPADRVLSMWEAAVPYSPSARILQAAKEFRAGRADAAERTVVRLMQESPGDPNVLRTAQAFYLRSGKAAELKALLEDQLKDHPGNIPALAVLVDLQQSQSKAAETMPSLEAARQALAADPDHLYLLSHLYMRANPPRGNEDILRQVLSIDPAHPPASNDLGYSLAEQGEQLGRAESLIRQAVAAEPENPSYLDSLGWVLYKQGKFAEARPNLEKAAADWAQPDPIVLDHLGDVLYRLGDKAAAAKQWELATAKLAKSDDTREDWKALKTSLEQKTKQLKAGEPVTVSPVEEARQAKK